MRSFRFITSALPVPADTPVEGSGAVTWVSATALALAMLVPIVVTLIVNGVASSVPLLTAYLFVVGVSCVTHVRKIANWEDERGVELLWARHRFTRSFYTRPRAMPGGNPTPQP